MSIATLTLEHDFPSGSIHKALVDVNLLLSNLQSTDTRIGEWVNVMGYITAPPSNQHRNPEDRKTNIFVQAIVLWSAGGVKLDEYENVLADQLRTN
jgi:hypothetical protein